MQARRRQRTAFSPRWDLPGEHDEGVKEDCEGMEFVLGEGESTGTKK